MNYIRSTHSKQGRIQLFEPPPVIHYSTVWEELAQAVILQAVEDYRKTLKRLKKDPYCMELQKRQLECEIFFYSEWFTVLSKVDPDVIVEKIRKEMDE